mmetsp:Transcript_46725/g.124927  ORF Transcript_46725/g.124927 Transcript_46725/m.124927 type:complete len:224 (-) Transcript_46725:12-683(-)
MWLAGFRSARDPGLQPGHLPAQVGPSRCGRGAGQCRAGCRPRAQQGRVPARLGEAAARRWTGGLGGPAEGREARASKPRGPRALRGGAGGGLYEEKHDVNEGRLAETHKEQRDWISGISAWAEISDVAFADEQDKSCISVYMTLPGVHEIPANKVCIWFRASSLEVRVVDLNGKNWCWVAQELWGQIDPDRCTYKIRRDKLSLKLSKRQSARSWDRWEKLRRI